jgi:hypothetical protein
MIIPGCSIFADWLASKLLKTKTIPEEQEEAILKFLMIQAHHWSSSCTWLLPWGLPFQS